MFFVRTDTDQDSSTVPLRHSIHAYLDPSSTATVELDTETIADLVHEAIQESQKSRGVTALQTNWFDAAEAAELLLFHVTNLAGGEVNGE